MAIMTAARGVEPWRYRLLLPTYRIAEAARYAHVSTQTAAHWHYRQTATGLTLPGRERGRSLSYLELVELAVVAVFRRFNVPLENVRKARQYMQQTFSAEYPFTTYRFKTDGFHLLTQLAQFEPRLGLAKLIVADKGGQLGWETVMEDKLFEFDYESDLDLAVRWHVDGRDSPVVIDPRIAFGAPMVKGTPTWVLKGRWEAGENLEDLQEDFGLRQGDIQRALKFEGIAVAA